MVRFILIATVAFVIAVGLTPWARNLSFRFGFVVAAGGRRQHQGKMPLLGGVAVFIAYAVAIGLIFWLVPPENDAVFRPIRGVIFGSIFVFVGGLLDDKFELSYYWQFVIQFGAAIIANLHVAFLERISNPFPGLTDIPLPGVTFDSAENLIIFDTWLAWLITTLWIVGMINAVNFFDGIDGLATGVGAIACLFFAWHGYSLALGLDDVTATNIFSVPTFSLALAAALLGFLVYNFPVASIFLGSAGVYLLAYNLATLSLLAPAKLATALLVLALPILDGLYRAAARLSKGRSPFSGDRGHLHFLLLDQGWSARQILLFYYSVALLFGFVAIFAPAGFFKLAALLVLVSGLLIFIKIRTGRSQ